MSIILTVHKVEFSVRDRYSKYERTHKLMLIWYDVPQKAILDDSKFSYCLSTRNKSYMLQMNFVNTAGKDNLADSHFYFSF